MLQKTLAVSIALAAAIPAYADTLVVYSSRAEHLLKPIVAKYEQQTGTKIQLVQDSAGPLMEKMRAEGRNSPADVFITVDGGNLWQASQMGLLRPINSNTLKTNIPAHLRDPKNDGTAYRYARAPFFTIPIKSNRPTFPAMQTWLTPNGKAACACALPTMYTTNRWWAP